MIHAFFSRRHRFRWPAAVLLAAVLLAAGAGLSQRKSSPPRPSPAKLIPPARFQPLRPRINLDLPPPPVNTAAHSHVTVHVLSGQSPGSPFTISRVFARGDIPEFPRPFADGRPLEEWQADVKTRWPDGSVQHALVSFIAPVSPNESFRVSFASDPHPCHAGPRDACEAAAIGKEAMLGFNGGNWNAAIRADVQGHSHTVSARLMLEAWNGETSAEGVRYWLRGPVVTQVIVEDRSPALAYDFGFRDRRTTVVDGAVPRASETKIPVTDASVIASLPLPVRIKINSEEMTVCAVEGNILSVGVASCPNADGRGTGNTQAAAHGYGSVVQILPVLRPGGWKDRPIGALPYNFRRGMAPNAVTTGIYTPEFLQTIPVPFEAQIGDEMLRVCEVRWGAPGVMRFGESPESCGNTAGRGIGGTTAAHHPDNSLIFSPAWPADWEPAPSDRYKSLHPIFVLTFYKGWKGVKEEFILENVFLQRLQDQYFHLALLNGPALSNTLLSTPLLHRAQTRWRRVFWEGEPPPEVRIDYNFPYIIHSGAVPSFDLERTINPRVFAAEYQNYVNAGKAGFTSLGLYQPGFATAGGRPDIGLFPSWTVRYLYSFDPAMYEIMMGSAEVGASIPLHTRESDESRAFDGQGAVAGFGRFVSVHGRPGYTSKSFDNATARDRITPVGMTLQLARQFTSSRRADNWGIDLAHQPSTAFIPYVISGDWYLLEELQFWAAYNVLYSTYGNCDYCRKDPWGLITDSVENRGLAWGLRTVAHAAWATPDSEPEKPYLKDRIDHFIAVREGIIGLTGGAYYDPSPDSPWSWGRTVVNKNLPNPLHFIFRDLGAVSGNGAGYVQPSLSCFMDSVWMTNFNFITWGHMEELGFTNVGPLRREAMKFLLELILSPDYAPKEMLGAAYLASRDGARPCEKSKPYETWTAVLAAMDPQEAAAAPKRWAAGAGDPEHGYPAIMLAAASFLPGVQSGPLLGEDAWRWMKNNVARQEAMNDNPKWALVPRPADPAAILATLEARSRPPRSGRK